MEWSAFVWLTIVTVRAFNRFLFSSIQLFWVKQESICGKVDADIPFQLFVSLRMKIDFK